MKLERIAYTDGPVALAGLYGKPKGRPRAAVAVFPTFMNSTPRVEAKAAELVESGFAVFIADLYGPDAPDNPQEAFVAMGRLRADPVAMRKRLRASLDTLRERHANLPQLAIGFCLGGACVLELAREGADLAGVVSFHGILATDMPASTAIRSRILVCHGDADSLVPRRQVIAFWEEMDAVAADWHFHSYSGVEHGFTNPYQLDGTPNPAFNGSADRQSWAAMHALFDEIIG